MVNKPQFNQTIYVTQEEYDTLLQQLKEKEKALNEASKSIWETTEQSSETRHDNAPFDAAVEATKLLDTQYQRLLKQLQYTKVLSKTQEKFNHIVFWTKALIILNLQEKEIQISWISDFKNWKIASTSPLWQALLGKKEWDNVSFKVWNNINNVNIKKIID